MLGFNPTEYRKQIVAIKMLSLNNEKLKAENSMNKTQFNQSILPILCGFALLTLTVGLSLFYIEQQFDIIGSALTLLGCITFITFISLRIKNTRHKQSTRLLNLPQLKTLTLVLTIIIASIGFVGSSNYLANFSTLRWDVTQDKQHTLATHTIEFVSTLTEPVKLTAFYVGMPPKYLQDLFKEYERVSAGLVTTEIIDPIEQIAYAAKFGNVVRGEERKVIVQSGDNRKDVDFTESFLSEEKLTNAIARVSRPPRKVYFLTGHGEYSLSNDNNVGLSIFQQLLADNNIASKPLMLGISNNIPDDCDVLIISGPRNQLTKNEITTIKDYLINGGDALFLIDHTIVTTPEKTLTADEKQKNPALNSILNHWGLNVQSDIIVDLTNHVGNDVGSPATKNYPRHKAITDGLDYTFYVRPRSIRVLEQRRPTIKLAPIALTASTENSWAETNRTLDIQFDQGIDTAGPVPFAYVVFEKGKEQENKASGSQDTRLIVFTDADFLTNVYINQYSNAQMGLNIVNWLADLDYKVFISSQKIKVARLDLTSKQKRQVLVILFLMPFFFLIAGLVSWLNLRFTN